MLIKELKQNEHNKKIERGIREEYRYQEIIFYSNIEVASTKILLDIFIL